MTFLSKCRLFIIFCFVKLFLFVKTCWFSFFSTKCWVFLVYFYQNIDLILFCIFFYRNLDFLLFYLSKCRLFYFYQNIDFLLLLSTKFREFLWYFSIKILTWFCLYIKILPFLYFFYQNCPLEWPKMNRSSMFMLDKKVD